MSIQPRERVNVIKDNNKIVIYNEITKSWLRVSERYYDMHKDSIEQEDSELRHSMERYGILRNDTGLVSDRRFRTVFISLTNRCNMSCEFCASSVNSEVKHSEFSTEVFRNIILPKLKEMNPRNIVLTGGEPFIRKDIIEIVTLLKSTIPNGKIILQSNGLLIDDDHISALSRYIHRIDISVENMYTNTHDQSTIEELIKSIKAKGIDIVCSYVINRKTQENVVKAIDLVEENNVGITFRVMSPLGSAINLKSTFLDSDEIILLYKNMADYIISKGYKNNRLMNIFGGASAFPKRSCEALSGMVTISANGEVHSCINLREEDYVYGNILSENVADLENVINCLSDSPSMKELFLVDDNRYCQNCPIRHFCGGFCAATRYYNGDNEIVTDMCRIKYIWTRYVLFYRNEKANMTDNLNAFLNVINLENSIEEEKISVNN